MGRTLNAIGTFFTDLEEHGLEDDAVVTVFNEHPSLDPADQVEGDTAYNNDFRGLHSTLLEDWMGIDRTQS